MSVSSVFAFIKGHWYLAAALVLLILSLVRFLNRRRKERRKQEEMAHLKRRDEALSDALRNPLMADNPELKENGEAPVEVKWGERAAQSGKSGKRQDASEMIEITEISTYARKKYVLHGENRITVGSGPGCTLVIQKDGVAPIHFDIFPWSGKLCMRSAPGTQTSLRRGKNQAAVGTDGVYLKNGDQILAGTAVFEIRMFRA